MYVRPSVKVLSSGRIVITNRLRRFFVEPGASLSIEEGTTFPWLTVGGARFAKIYALETSNLMRFRGISSTYWVSDHLGGSGQGSVQTERIFWDRPTLCILGVAAAYVCAGAIKATLLG